MTVSEFLSDPSEKKGFAGGRLFAVGIDITEEQNAEQGSFILLDGNFADLSVSPAPRTEVRKFVDGDRTVPVSEGMKIRFTLYPVYDDPVQNCIMEAVERSSDVRCVYADGLTGKMTGALLFPRIVSGKDDELFGRIYIIELS